MTITPAITVRGLLDAQPESVGLTIDLLAGANGLGRRITSPYIQKTGLALAGWAKSSLGRAASRGAAALAWRTWRRFMGVSGLVCVAV